MRHRHSHPVTITLTPKLFLLAEKIAEEEGRTRSELFREALRKYVWERSWKKLQEYGAKKAREMGVKSDEDIERLIDEGRV
ncbi:MAG: ribbon-helix-helix protein, CopG family [Elusimicrobia bacterium]|nr:ribbon-helix-helix protein, CopG family [Elusimicrobiota bacterium]